MQSDIRMDDSIIRTSSSNNGVVGQFNQRSLCFIMVDLLTHRNAVVVPSAKGVQVGATCQPRDVIATNEDGWSPVVCAGRGLLSPLIRNRIHTMGLDLMPRASGPESSEFPPGMTHRTSDPCPFKNTTVQLACSARAARFAEMPRRCT